MQIDRWPSQYGEGGLKAVSALFNDDFGDDHFIDVLNIGRISYHISLRVLLYCRCVGEEREKENEAYKTDLYDLKPCFFV